MIQSPLNGKTYDVIVCGAGSAGIAAACAAARAGTRTLLLEHYGFGGGIITTAMIHTLDAVKSCADNNQNVVAGIAKELVDEIVLLGGNATPDNPPEALTVHPEIYKIAVDRLLARSGVTVLYHAHACDVIKEGDRVTGVEVSLRDGRARFSAGCIVDATGDAQLAFYAGALFDIAPDLQALTYHFRLGGIDPAPRWDEWEELTRSAIQAAHAVGEMPVFGGPWIIRLAAGEISVNSTRVYGNPVDAVQLSAAEQAGRAQMLQIWNILRQRVTALADCYVIAGASQLHVRESRIIRGDYQLTEDDIKRRTVFPDAVALGAWPIDIHPANGYVGVHPHKESPPVPYEIPYRCLLPRGLDGLIVAGKPISTTHRAHGSTRVPGTSLATGQAAGVAATLAVREGVSVRAVDVEKLRALLRQQGAIVSVDGVTCP